MVCSLDGVIAKPDGDVSWLRSHDRYDEGVTLSDQEIVEFLNDIDCYVMGSRTYEHSLDLGWPYGDTPVVVLTSRSLKSDKVSVEFHSGNLADIVNKNLKPRFKNIWMVGGANAAREFIRHDLADEIVISIMPVVLGDGLLLFDSINTERKLHLHDTKAYRDGIVELTYQIIKRV